MIGWPPAQALGSGDVHSEPLLFDFPRHYIMEWVKAVCGAIGTTVRAWRAEKMTLEDRQQFLCLPDKEQEVMSTCENVLSHDKTRPFRKVPHS